MKYYCVDNENRVTLVLATVGDAFEKNVLVNDDGNTITLFRSYDEARNAIRRTMRYVKARNLNAWILGLKVKCWN